MRQRPFRFRAHEPACACRDAASPEAVSHITLGGLDARPAGTARRGSPSLEHGPRSERVTQGLGLRDRGSLVRQRKAHVAAVSCTGPPCSGFAAHRLGRRDRSVVRRADSALAADVSCTGRRCSGCAAHRFGRRDRARSSGERTAQQPRPSRVWVHRAASAPRKGSAVVIALGRPEVGQCAGHGRHSTASSAVWLAAHAPHRFPARIAVVARRPIACGSADGIAVRSAARAPRAGSCFVEMQRRSASAIGCSWAHRDAAHAGAEHG